MAMERGRRGERYLAAGRHMTMGALMNELAAASHIPAPTRKIPLPMLRLMAQIYELYYWLTMKPVLLSKSSVDLMSNEYLRTFFSHSKSQRELGCEFLPLNETLNDVLMWYQQHNFLPTK